MDGWELPRIVRGALGAAGLPGKPAVQHSYGARATLQWTTRSPAGASEFKKHRSITWPFCNVHQSPLSTRTPPPKLSARKPVSTGDAAASSRSMLRPAFDLHWTRKRKRARRHPLAHTRTPRDTRTDRHTDTDTHTQKHARTHTHAYTHTETHAHTCTRARTPAGLSCANNTGVGIKNAHRYTAHTVGSPPSPPGSMLVS